MLKGRVFPSHIKEACLESGVLAPFILNVSSRWRWEFNFTPWPLYSQERTPVSIEYEAWRVLEQMWTFWRRKISCGCQGSSPVSSSIFPSYNIDIEYARPENLAVIVCVTMKILKIRKKSDFRLHILFVDASLCCSRSDKSSRVTCQSSNARYSLGYVCS